MDTVSTSPNNIKEEIKNPQSGNSGNNIFALIGKAFTGLIIVGVIFYAGYAIGSFSPKAEIPSPSVPTLAPASITVSKQAENPSPAVTKYLPSPTMVIDERQNLGFKYKNVLYTFKAPKEYHLSQKKEGYSDEFTIGNNSASLNITMNDATEGVPCGFPDSPVLPSEMFTDVSSLNYKTYTQFKNSQGIDFRRVDITANPSAGLSFFAVCQKMESGWIQPTSFGFVRYEIPYSDNPEKEYADVLKILDEIFASIKSGN